MDRTSTARTGLLTSAGMIVLGLWVGLSPFVLGVDTAGQWHLYLWGLVLVVLGAAQARSAVREHGPVPGLGAVAALAGAWLALSAAVYRYSTVVAWSLIVVGLLVAGLGLHQARSGDHAVRNREGARHLRRTH